jgi:hypothetical protein
MRRLLFCLFFVLSTTCSTATAEEATVENVRLSLDKYNELVEASRSGEKVPPLAPAGYALGTANIQLQNTRNDKEISAQVTITLSLKVLIDEWQGIPILPAGTPIQTATLDNRPVQLVSSAHGLLWATNKVGDHNLRLTYTLDATRASGGYTLSLPLPFAASSTINANLPPSIANVSVIPAAGTNITSSRSSTQVRATVPGGHGVQISWNAPTEGGHSLSRAAYRGTMKDEAISWSGTLQVELFDDKPRTFKVLPQAVTLSDLRVDGESTPILLDDGYFAARVSGKGKHEINIAFQSPVDKASGAPSVRLSVPKVPVSEFFLGLEGSKEVQVSPAAPVSREEKDGSTVSHVFVPMTEEVTFTWNEALPEEVEEKVRANAGIYHTTFAEEGVLYATAWVDVDITRGETNLITLSMPKGIEINRLDSDNKAIADWRVEKGESRDLLRVFFHHKRKGQLRFAVHFDRSLSNNKEDTKFEIPLIRAEDVNRQRGMLALLTSKERTLKPQMDESLTRVGENQLPAFVRQSADKTIAHTYKYVDVAPKLVVLATKPERKQGKFDAVVNTLVSLSDVTMQGSASIEVNVKSGSIMDLNLSLPSGINVLSLTAPSLRTHNVVSKDGGQAIEIFFTQEMEGQFRVEASYERILSDTDAAFAVPTLTVDGAEVEQGRIAVEALSAVEVQAVSTKQLSSLEPSELPQQLVLKTTNPILLAYKYVQTDPPYELQLQLTRHKEIDIQSATIDTAHYSTLITEDGLSVTSALFLVRNSRQQFLRVSLPEGSKVWSAYVDGKAEKPALASGDKKAGGPNVLIKIINSTDGFPVHLIFQTPVTKVGRLGVLESVLPKPDMVVTNTSWNVYLPDEVSYGRVESNMKITTYGIRMSGGAIAREVSKLGQAAKMSQTIAPLQLNVPTTGIRYSFQKLYANQGNERAYFSIGYTAGIGAAMPLLAILLGTALVWYGVYLLSTKSLVNSASSFAGGAGILGLVIGYFGASPKPALYFSGLIVLVAVGVLVKNVMAKKVAMPAFRLAADDGAEEVVDEEGEIQP